MDLAKGGEGGRKVFRAEGRQAKKVKKIPSHEKQSPPKKTIPIKIELPEFLFL
ncbi:hypothetical protein H9X84_10775 [Anaerotignum lactatifermentans]|nr:hypothetical protein [Anaerotignum lactatifermentans]